MSDNGVGAKLINEAAVRRFILDAVAEQRPHWRCTRVSREALDYINARVRIMIRSLVHQHPCGCGQTFRP